jgi:hypothetical protein
MVAHPPLKRKRAGTIHGYGLLIVHRNAVEGNRVCAHRQFWLSRKVLKIKFEYTSTPCQIVKFRMASCAKAWREVDQCLAGLTSLTKHGNHANICPLCFMIHLRACV